MTGKDPKDMTASELMRYLHDRNSSCSCFMCNKVLNIVGCGEHVCADAYEALADKIDAELSQARKESLLQGAQVWAKANGWPDFREGEDFGQWLVRCAIKRPCFENGEPVQWSDSRDIAWNTDGEWFFNAVKEDGVPIAIGSKKMYAKASMTDDGRVVRHAAPEALGADGKPIVEGETVWLDEAHSRCAGSCGFEDGNKYSLCGIERQEMLTVEDAHIEVDGREYVRVCTCGAWCHASWLTHTPPETQERIDDDATLSPREYYNAHIGHDVGLKDDEEVAVAMVHDLLRRQRELDKRTGGAE